MRTLTVTLLGALALVGSCGKGDGAANNARDSLLGAWKQAGLETSAFTAATIPAGKDCATGTVAKVDVLVCTFATADEAKAAQDAGLQWVGDTTGVSQAKGTFLIAAADRHKTDPNGKTINQIFKSATK